MAPRISSLSNISNRLGFVFFSLRRYFKGGAKGGYTTPGASPAAQDTSLPYQDKEKENIAFRLLEFLYTRIVSIYKFLFRGGAGTTRILLYPIKKIATFFFEKVLDLTEWFYVDFLNPFYDRFGYIFQGTLMVLKSKPVFVVLVFIASAFLAQVSLVGDPKHVLIFVLVPFVLLLAFFYPIMGLCTYLLFGLGMLHKMIWNFPRMYTGTPLILASMGAYAVRVLVGREKEFTWVHDNQNLIVMALWSILTLALKSGWSQPYYYLGFVGWLLMYFLAIQIIGSSKKRLIIYMCCLCFIYGIYAYGVVRNAFYYGVQTEYTITVNDVRGRMADNNELGACLNMALPLFLGLGLLFHNKLLKLGFLGMTVVDGAAVIYTNSRGALLGFSVLLLPMIFKLILSNKRVRTIGMIVVLVLGVSGVSFFHEKVGKRLESIMNWKTDGAAKNRIMGFVGGMYVMQAKPLFGVGAGNMGTRIGLQKYCPNVITIRYWFGKDGTITLRKPQAEKGGAGQEVGVELHNAYGAVGGENGVFVLFLWVFLMVYSIVQLHYLRRNLPRIPENEWAHILSHALELSTLSYMLTAAFLNNFSEGLIYMVLAASLSLRHIALRKKGTLDITSAMWLLLLVGIWLYYTFFIRFFVYSF